MREHTLAIPELLRKVPRQCRAQLLACQFTHVKVLRLAVALRIDDLVRRRNDERPVAGEHAREFGEHRFLLGDVLDGLEGYDEIDACIRKRKLRAGALHES